ncbi:dihydroxyacetone kinase [Rhizodiscina lignyota]|uniref:Dihydroxyacetone kinase n=1 Tax=Rhizodiscina lignyota TaxID=1504668 RepID=A0A9P4IKB3_9PEZI|nr:dihydroxyacetone kinase [Rhizodiscina lignyota]
MVDAETTKHFINDPTHLVNTALRAVTLTNPSVDLDAENKVIYRKPSSLPAPQVSIVSGGGSGHEPSFAAFVGHGLLTGAVAGTIFASPSAEQIRRCLMQRVSGEKGILVTVMNYTGDVLNFGMAVEKAKASGREVEMVVVGDDVGVGREQGGKVGRRGIAGTVLVHKISGALAATGASLKEVAGVAQLVSDNIVSIGTSLSHVHVPGREKPQASDEELKEDEAEIGMGIHNEPGSEKATDDLPGLVKKMLGHLLDQSDSDRSFLDVSSKDEVVLFINNLGGTSVLELGGITNEAVEQLQKDYSIKPVRIISGTFMTSLNGLGFSITLLRIRDTGLGKSMLELLDAPAEATGWAAAISTKTWAAGSQTDAGKAATQASEEGEVTSNLKIDHELAKKALTSGLNRVIAAEADITQYDTIVGDGDCGIGLKRGAEAILKVLDTSRPTDDAVLFLDRIIGSVENTMDGTSGALYAIFLNALANGLRTQDSSSAQAVTVETWSKALASSLQSLSKYTPAKPGDRTLIDALHPFVETLEKTRNVKSAAEAADAGAKSTRGMKASLGRTVYVGGEGWQGVPDPGAHGLAEILTGLSDGLN